MNRTQRKEVEARVGQLLAERGSGNDRSEPVDKLEREVVSSDERFARQPVQKHLLRL
jgi:hypothetical protein